MAYTVIVKNDTTADVGIEDLGISVPASSQIEFVGSDGLFKFDTVATSDDLKTYVGNGTLVINNGSEDLEIPYGLAHISFEEDYQATQGFVHEDIIMVDDGSQEVLVDDDTLNVLIDDL